MSVAATLLAGVLLLRLVDWAELGTGLGAAADEPLILTGLIPAYTLAFWLRSLAWSGLLSTQVSPGRLLSILLASLFVNHVLPFKAGDLLRPYLATRQGVPAAEAASTTVVARLLDFVVLAAFASVALISLRASTGVVAPFAVAVSMLGGATLGVLLLRSAPFAFLPAALMVKIDAVRTSLRQIQPSQLLRVFPLVALSWLLEGLVLLAAAWLLDVPLSIQLAIGATAFTVIFQVIHLTPGGLGVYETSMASVLTLSGLSAEQAVTLALLTHGLKFAYSFTIGLAAAVFEAVDGVRQKSASPQASRFEIVSARAWNVLNEGKPFTPVFTLSVLLLLSLPHAVDVDYWRSFALALAAIVPLALVFFRFDFPLRLRAALWAYLAVFLALFGFVDLTVIALAVTLYLGFTVLVWGSVYYHLRIGTPLTNFLRFWRLVVENPDPTSGNFLEQTPKFLLLLLAFGYVHTHADWTAVAGVEAFTLAILVSAVLLQQWFFTWVPALPQKDPRPAPAPNRRSRRFIAIVIDGCRLDRLNEAHTPFIDRLRREGTEYTDLHTVYPARTVTCFASMLTGAPPRRHGMRSNFVPSLGVKCSSVFDALRRGGLTGRLVGIAHLIDAFGDEDVRSVTAVMHNDEIDEALVNRAKQTLIEDDPELLVLQLLSVDQTGHARGSYYPEYLHKIEATDGIIEDFVAWCEARGYLEGATLLITADHGQGIGIGGHGHMTPPEIHVPCILWGEGVVSGVRNHEPRFVTDIAATICDRLGVEQPDESVGASLLPSEAPSSERPLVVVIPAYNEAANLPGIIANVRAAAPASHRVVVVDDGSTDGSGDVARGLGVIVVRHERNRGLGAALRTGLTKARELDARAAVYLDADGEYDASEMAPLVAPIDAGEADYVLGSRFRGRVEGMTPVRRAGNQVFSALLSLACGRWLSDGQTGFRAFSRRALDVAEIIHDYNYAQVLTLNLLRKGMRLREAPVSYRRRQNGSSFVSPAYLWRVPLGMAREMLSD